MIRLLYILAAVIILGYFIWAFGRMLRFYLALKASNTVVVERYVDWPSVRRNIACDLNPVVGKMLNDKIGNSFGIKGNRVKLSLKSSSVAETLAAQIATPAAFIFLFNRPTQLHCLEGMKSEFRKEFMAIVWKLTTKYKIKTNSSLRSPNIFRVHEKTNYVFFPIR